MSQVNLEKYESSKERNFRFLVGMSYSDIILTNATTEMLNVLLVA